MYKEAAHNQTAPTKFVPVEFQMTANLSTTSDSNVKEDYTVRPQTADDISVHNIADLNSSTSMLNRPINPSGSRSRNTAIPIDDSDTQSSGSSNDSVHPTRRLVDFDMCYAQREGWFRSIFALFAFAIAIFSNAVVQAWAHDRARNIVQLPDLLFIGTEQRWAEDVMNWCVGLTMFVALINTLMHQYRRIVARRILLLLAILYTLRSFTLLFTQLPPSYSEETREKLCAPAVANVTFDIIASRVLQKVLSFGQGTAGVCGDMLFSGHTMLCTVCILFTHRYTPRPHRIYLLCILWPLLVVIVVLLLISRSHYTVDILFGYWLAIGLFVIYHMYCEMKAGKHRIRSEARMLLYMESDTPSGRLPNAYNWPLPWPVKLNEFLLKHTSSRRLMLNQCERIPSESSGDEMHAGTTVTGGATNVGGASIDVENGRRTVSSTTPLHPARRSNQYNTNEVFDGR